MKFSFTISRHHSLLHWLDSSELIQVSSDGEDIKIRVSKLCLLRRIFHYVFSIGIEIGAFFLQFCEWWFSKSESGSSILSNLPIPSPPKANETYRNICPLCRSTVIKTPTLLNISGFVFCYKCIVNHIRTTGKCPVSDQPCTEDQLTRLYQH